MSANAAAQPPPVADGVKQSGGDAAATRVKPSLAEVLDAAVGNLGGEYRPGQVEMARAVQSAMQSGQHLLVQAGTGTGKSLAYLVPAVLHHDRVVVATATLALQHQLVERDIPALLDAAADVLGARPSYAVLKGRSNYACLHRVRDGVPDDQGTLVDLPAGSMGAEVLALRGWAEVESKGGGVGDRDSAPPHTDRLWQQVSVSHRECLGAAKCPYGIECFAERARERAMASRLIVTNHSLLAIDAIEGVPMIPEYDVVVVDEAHELASRVTQAATDELTVAMIERSARRARNFLDDGEAEELGDSADGLRAAIDDTEPGRVDRLPDALAGALTMIRNAARAAFSAFPKESSDADANAARQQARGMVDEIRKIAERLAAHDEADVTWIAERDRSRGGSQLCVAPLQVWGQLRSRLLSDNTVVFTSATLKLGGDFTAMATSIGLKPSERADHSIDTPNDVSALAAVEVDDRDGQRSETPTASANDETPEVLEWRGIDVGSPFDYQRQSILYVARHLPTPGRDGIGSAQLEEIQGLVEAAGGRTLGLFSSRRAAEAAAEAVREALPHLPILCQGDGQLSHLRAEFIANPAVSLFGTLSLWQGLDVPGPTCQLVLIDRIPFPRPDDPLMSARARAADKAGSNGFMAVSATHAALLLAQGSGRLIRTQADRGVVVILDPRLATARYGSFLRASLPPMWTTYDGSVARAALQRLSA
ncbi:MAG: ATP-dependent DNA helicase [Actinomycetota bacterium]|nr:ATP-dependent DNA helicase [Nocardioidaceae bacterium]MDQ3481233.1 ATP-dependent DNA helicase [Actinomycetota bacterium]